VVKGFYLVDYCKMRYFPGYHTYLVEKRLNDLVLSLLETQQRQLALTFNFSCSCELMLSVREMLVGERAPSLWY
jgi:hypothetical protein